MDGFTCTHIAVLSDVPHQLWEAITTDGPGGTPLWMTRMLHNKPLFYLLNYARCYFHYLSPHFVSESLNPYLAIAMLLLVYYLWKRGGRAWSVVRLLILLYPLVFLFELQRKL